MSLRILEAGLQTLLVDLGRPRSRSLGVPVGGAADRWSLALGNALVGNPPATAAVEITLAGPTLQADTAVAGVLFGAPFELASDRQAVTAGKTFTLTPGEILRIRSTPRGLRAYLCLAGGFAAPRILGSRSSLEPLRAGMILDCPSGTLPGRFLDSSAQITLPSALPHTLRFVPGPQAGWFDLHAFARQVFTVSPDSNRMGLRLSGVPLAVAGREMVSEPVCSGAVQVTNDGQCIILGIDGQTIGGYPKAAQVIQADLDSLGQLRPGDTIRFDSIGLAEAEEAGRARFEQLGRWLAGMIPGVDCSGVISRCTL
jgi:biotin-dependent carboxylase-like uncharacterized protein